MWHGVLRRPGGLLAAALTLLLAAGCHSPTASVSGKVTYKGQPLPGADVAFMTPDTKWVGHATADQDGNYTISNVPLGEVKATVSAPRPQGPPGIPGSGPPRGMAPPKGADLPPDWQKSAIYNPAAGGARAVALPAKYSDPEKSGLSCWVQAGQNTFDILLQ